MSNRDLCTKCERNLARKGRKLCTSCTGKGRAVGRFAYRASKKDYCEICMLKPIHKCVLDIDHRNGDKTDNRPENHITLCANCHRVKTCIAQESRNIRHRRINDNIN